MVPSSLSVGTPVRKSEPTNPPEQKQRVQFGSLMQVFKGLLENNSPSAFKVVFTAH